MDTQFKNIQEKLNGLDIIDMEVGFGFSSLKLTYSWSDYSESEIVVDFKDIVHFKYTGNLKKTEGSLYIGENKFCDINEYINSSDDSEVIENVKKILQNKNKLLWFKIEGEIYLEIICGSIDVHPNP